MGIIREHPPILGQVDFADAFGGFALADFEGAVMEIDVSDLEQSVRGGGTCDSSLVTSVYAHLVWLSVDSMDRCGDWESG